MHYLLVKDRHGRYLGQMQVDERVLADLVKKETPFVSSDVLRICAIIAQHYWPGEVAYVEEPTTGEIAIASVRSPT